MGGWEVLPVGAQLWAPEQAGWGLKKVEPPIMGLLRSRAHPHA